MAYNFYFNCPTPPLALFLWVFNVFLCENLSVYCAQVNAWMVPEPSFSHGDSSLAWGILRELGGFQLGWFRLYCILYIKCEARFCRIFRQFKIRLCQKNVFIYSDSDYFRARFSHYFLKPVSEIQKHYHIVHMYQ